MGFGRGMRNAYPVFKHRPHVCRIFRFQGSNWVGRMLNSERFGNIVFRYNWRFRRLSPRIRYLTFKPQRAVPCGGHLYWGSRRQGRSPQSSTIDSNPQEAATQKLWCPTSAVSSRSRLRRLSVSGKVSDQLTTGGILMSPRITMQGQRKIGGVTSTGTPSKEN